MKEEGLRQEETPSACKGQHCKQSKSLFIESSFSSKFLGIQLVPIKQKLQSKFATM